MVRSALTNHFHETLDQEREENQALLKLWNNKINKFKGKVVVCTKSGEINYTAKTEEGKEYTIKEVHMYLGVIPTFEFECMPKKQWSTDNFKLKDEIHTNN